VNDSRDGSGTWPKRKFGIALTVVVLSVSLTGLSGCEVEDASNQGRTKAQKQAAKLKRELAQAKVERLRDLARAKRRAKAAAQRAYEQAQAAVVEPEPVPAEPSVSDCDPNYSGACLDPSAYDYDCEGGSGDGPEYTGYVQVVGDDPHDLDSDGDGTGCE